MSKKPPYKFPESEKQLKGRLKLLVLYLLNERPLHGYGLMKELDRVFGHKPYPGAIYPLMRGLLKDGLVKIIKTESRQKVYKITEKGKNYLKKHKKELEKTIEMAKNLKEMNKIGIEKIKEAFYELFFNFNKLSDQHKKKIRESINKFYEEIMNIILELKRSD